MTDTASLPSALYHRPSWQRDLDDNKIDMGLMPAFDQDRLDHDLVRAVLEDNQRGQREMVALGADVQRMLLAPVVGTVLHLAATRSSLRTLVTLLQLGADPFLRNSAGQTARDMATQRGAGGARLRTVLRQWEQRRMSDMCQAVNDDGLGAQSAEDSTPKGFR